MKDVLDAQNPSSDNQGPLTNSPAAWVKPEVKAAEVGQATLASTHTRNTADLSTCSS